MNDIKFALRQLAKNTGFTAVAVLTLALGIGANTAIFSIVNAVLLRPLPYESPGQLVRLWGKRPGGAPEDLSCFTPAEITQFREQLTTLQEVGMFDVGMSGNLTGGEQPERVNMAEASPGLFTVLRAKPMLGRTFLREEMEVAQSKVAVISEGLWQRRFGADPTLVGRTVRLDGEEFTVVGVLPNSFKVPENVDLWVPFSFTASDWRNDWGHYYVEVVGRLKPEISLNQAKAELETVARRREPQLGDYRKKWGVTVTPIIEPVVGTVRPTLLVLLGAVGFVLLIACANVANLLLARTTARRKEIAIRVALGVGRLRMVRQLLTESLVLALLGGGAGLLVAAGAVHLCSVTFAANLPRAQEITLDRRMTVFTLLLAVATGVGFGLVPALIASRPDLNEVLKEGGRNSAGSSRGRFRAMLVASEIALSLVLLVGAGLLLKSFFLLRSVDAGFDPHDILTMQLTLPKTKYPNTEQQNAFVQQALQQIGTRPGVESVAATINVPLVGTWGVGYSVPGQPDVGGQLADWANVTPGYFRTMKIALLKGRDFSEQDAGERPAVVIISAAFARKHFPNREPVGQRINVNGEREIVGVVGDVRPRGLERAIQPEIYVPYAQKATPATFLTLLVRTVRAPLSLAGSLEEVIRTLDRDLPVANVRTMEEIVSSSIAQRRLSLVLLGTFAALAVVLASVGIYGVVSYSVGQRTQEIGIRMALGARQADVIKLVVGQGLRPVYVGLAIGLGGAFALTRVMSNLLFGVSTTDPVTFGLAAVSLGAVAFGACLIPTRRAARVDPIIALRAE